MPSKIRTLLFSTLYPSSTRPGHGIFVETRLRELQKSGAVETKVVAPVPWFYSTAAKYGDYARMAATPRHEVRNGIEVWHPRYFLPPKVGMNIAPYALALGALPTIRRLQQEGFDFDLIDAHYYYPDGVAAGLLAAHFGKPFVVTARGTDLNLIPQYPFPRRLILSTARKAAASISVCRALSDELAQLGADPARLKVLRNGVDLVRFHPQSPAEARMQIGIEGDRILLSVGHLVERKGHHLVIGMLPLLPGYRLVIVGDGPERGALENLARQSGVADRVRFTGAVAQAELVSYYSAADVLVLASSREGWANVLLEAMACGTPVVATRIWGTPEVVSSPVAGRLAEERTSASLTAAVSALMADYPDRAEVRRYAESFSWEPTTRGQVELFHQVITAGDTSRAVKPNHA
ncbi:glycosyltransferase family 4 protein [Dechloromonas sp. H13]|uniref:glycosyltransferase family 4 protein n=1 Tax=Dechloromonas sp. H13 TaxID=2570193 RepID=UPI001D1840DB|nr:glycosyltransferase family 4 protein [Dechloromonas sp. H13]